MLLEGDVQSQVMPFRDGSCLAAYGLPLPLVPNVVALFLKGFYNQINGQLMLQEPVELVWLRTTNGILRLVLGLG